MRPATMRGLKVAIFLGRIWRPLFALYVRRRDLRPLVPVLPMTTDGLAVLWCW